MGKAPRAIVVDTYALMARATGEITPRGNECLEDIRRGKFRGIIHPIITYEFLLQFYKGRMPIFKAAGEALDFLETHFSTLGLTNPIALIAAEIRFKSQDLTDKIKRHLSVCDSITIAIAKKMKSPIVSGDQDLQTVANKENIDIIW
ncbi:MAG: PIN domain-containing protein [Candidatus Geothermarchaeales archaeon]